ncbi:hypothetical protein ES703_105021 [subsurface metagenome]
MGLGLGVSKNIDRRRVYIDLEDEVIYSTNTQYGGNTIGLKKLAMRLAINRASKEGWLTEHMLIMGVHGPKGRVSYLLGAFPSMCGKTSTAMIEGETIVGDDIAYLRKKGGEVRTVNVEKGMFGIIQGVNSKDDAITWKTLHTPGEIIFSNVLVTKEKGVCWIGKDGEVPKQGVNHSGEWTLGKNDAEGKEILPSHRNARFTFDLKLLENLDARLNYPDGVVVSGIIYGGRDSDTWVPVEESFSWQHGIITKGASLEFLISQSIQQGLTVRHIAGISKLDNRDRELGIGRAQAEEQDIQLVPRHYIFENLINLFESFVSINGIYLRTQSNAFGKKKFGMRFIPGLVVIAVKMNGVTFLS